MSGVGLSLIIDGAHCGILGFSDARISVIEDLQFTTGEGPCVDARRHDQPVSEPDLATTLRWPAYAPAAVAAGVAAVFALPLSVGAARFGALDLYRTEPGPLSATDLAQATLIADTATMLMIATQAAVPEGELAEAFSELVDHRAAVHQATGMISVSWSASGSCRPGYSSPLWVT